jgi:hypothetical protein
MGRGRECCAWTGFFVGCKSWLRKRALCENGVFCWLQEWGEKKRALGERGIFMARGTHSSIIKKSLPTSLEWLWDPFLSNKFNFNQIYSKSC